MTEESKKIERDLKLLGEEFARQRRELEHIPFKGRAPADVGDSVEHELFKASLNPKTSKTIYDGSSMTKPSKSDPKQEQKQRIQGYAELNAFQRAQQSQKPKTKPRSLLDSIRGKK